MTCPHCGSGFDSKDKEAITYCSDFCHDKVFIPRTSLPKLPEGWSGPFEASGRIVWGNYFNGRVAFASDFVDKDEATFLANLLNACYPANGTP